MEPPRGGGWGLGYSEKDEQSQGLLRDWGFESKVRALLNPRYIYIFKKKKRKKLTNSQAFSLFRLGSPCLLWIKKDLPSIA